jgi:hypothetical protein
MIYIATPMFGSVCSMYFTMSIENLRGYGIEYTLNAIGNESAIQRARNNYITEFYVNRDKYTHLMFWDSDVAIEPGDIKKLIESGKDVIGAPVRLKNKQHRLFSLTPVVNGWEDKENDKGVKVKIPIYNKEGSLLEVIYFATGIMLLSRKAVEDLIEDAKKKDEIYSHNSNPIKLKDTDLIYNVCKMDINDKSLSYQDRVYLSEDYWICNTLKQLGYKLWVDESINTHHYGMMDFEGRDVVIRDSDYI